MSEPTYCGTPPLEQAATDLGALPVLGQLQALTLEPGDILVFTCNPGQALTMAEEARMRRRRSPASSRCGVRHE